MTLNDVLSAIDSEIARMEKARKVLASYGGNKRGRRSSTNTQPAKAKRTLSAAARKRIAAAQRKRWAALKKASRVSS